MAGRSYGFHNQVNVGAMGVQLAKSVLRSRYPDIVDYETDMEMQRRGIDLLVPGLGLLEIKTDSHKPTNFYFELGVEGKPGAVDRSCADYYVVIFPAHHVMYLIPRPGLQKWLRDNMTKIRQRNWLRTVRSDQGRRTWQATGAIVPRKLLIRDIEIITVNWGEEEERVEARWEGGT